MKKIVKRMALILVLAMLATSLGGCEFVFAMLRWTHDGSSPVGPGGNEQLVTTTPAPVTTPIPVTTPDSTDGPAVVIEKVDIVFTLTDEDIARIDGMIDNCKTLSYSTTATREEVEQAWDALDEQLSFVSDQCSFAMILYYMDTSKEEANQLYLDAYDDYLALADKANLLQKDMYEDSPVKDWFFEDWTEEEIAYLQSYTSEQVEIQAKIEENNTKFVELEDDEVVTKFTELYIELVTLGNRQAQLCGYDNYYDYMSAMSYDRDYSAADREKFRNFVKTYLVPAYEVSFNKVMSSAQTVSYEGYNFWMSFMSDDYDSLDRNYLQAYIDSTTGSTYAYLTALFESGNYVMTDNPNAREGAFCTYFDYYDQGFCFFGPGYQSTTTVIHEMGHYYANTFVEDSTPFDLLETHSQGNEMLLLAHMGTKPAPVGYELTKNYELFDQLITIIISCMVDEFESQIYAMEDVSGLTEEQVTQMITAICDDYFADYGGEDFVSENLTDMQWYIRYVSGLSPAYYISYATSGVTAMNIFAQAQEDTAAARELYRKLVEEAPKTEGYEAALNAVGAASPFDEESFKTIVALFN